ncbi:MAG: segregation/condensation protein A [Thermoplasmata archaeon]|jgi:segregation and condensation protein A
MDSETIRQIMNGSISDEALAEYIREYRDKRENYYLSIEDQKLKAIALAFELVIEENLNPLDIDLVKFTELFLKKVRNENLLDFITAGKLILMAWEILYMKSERVLEKFSPQEDDFYGEWEPYNISSVEEYNYDLTDTIVNSNVIEEPVRHVEKRQITLTELLGALKEAMEESENRKKELEERKVIEERYRLMIGERLHKDSLEDDIKEIWARIAEMEDEFIKKQIEDGTKEDSIKTLLSLLFLESQGKVELLQNRPFDDIYVHVLVPKELRKIEFIQAPKVEVVQGKP